MHNMRPNMVIYNYKLNTAVFSTVYAVSYLCHKLVFYQKVLNSCRLGYIHICNFD